MNDGVGKIIDFQEIFKKWKMLLKTSDMISHYPW